MTAADAPESGGGIPQRRFTPPPGATEIVMVRHGASAPAREDAPFPLLDGHGNPPLSPTGHEQAELVARRLATTRVDAIFVTGLTRTVETAAPLAARLRIEPVAIPELREVKLGDWEGGLFRIRMAAGDPIAWRVLAEQRWDVIPGAESMAALAARVTAGIDRIVAHAGPDSSVVAVLHGGIIGEVCRQATDGRALAFAHADNTSITRLIVLPERRLLVRSFNDTAHLDGAA